MQTAFVGEQPDLDRTVREVAAERPGHPLRLRVQPMILGKNSQYRSWKDVSWTVEVDTPEEAYATREALRAFFDSLAKHGPAATRAALTGNGGGEESAA